MVVSRQDFERANELDDEVCRLARARTALLECELVFATFAADKSASHAADRERKLTQDQRDALRAHLHAAAAKWFEAELGKLADAMHGLGVEPPEVG